MADPQGKKWHDMVVGGQGAAAAMDIVQSFGKGAKSRRQSCPRPGTAAYTDAWEKTIDAAEKANEPGRFTAFIGYEWTSNTAGNNLHRNVIFRDNGERARQVEPYTTIKPLGSDNPVDLWTWMAAVRGEDRRQRARDRAQRQLVERTHVSPRRGVRQKTRSRVCRRSREVGTDLRSDADQR